MCGETPYRQAAEVLPPRLLRAAEGAAGQVQASGEEFRLRVGTPMTILAAGREYETDAAPVTEDDLRALLEQASRCSAHTVLDRVRTGYLTVKGGHRIGLCGEAVMKGGELHTLGRLSSAAVRIARPVEDGAGQALAAITEGDAPASALILAPPGAGKTTLLRALVRRVSNGEGTAPLRVGLADERGEVAALWEGVPQLDVGRRTDIMSGCPKAQGLSILLRGMNPQVLAVDEVTAEADVDAMAWAAGCGVTLLATAHGGGTDDLRRRPLYRRLLELGLFRRVILLKNRAGRRELAVEALS